MSILCYHEVAPDWDSPLCVTPTAFEEHLAWLAKHRRLLPLEVAERSLTRAARLAAGTSAITFDDGYRGVFEHAFPLLKRMGIPATVFLVSEAARNSHRAIEWLDESDLSPSHTVFPLTIDQIFEMRESGISFGSHSHTHPDLTAVSIGECETELRTSKEYLEDLLKAPVVRLAYPRGRHNEAVRAAAEKVGFRACYSLPGGREFTGRMAIPRVGVYGRNRTLTVRIKSSRYYLPARSSVVLGGIERSLKRQPRLPRF